MEIIRGVGGGGVPSHMRAPPPPPFYSTQRRLVINVNNGSWRGISLAALWRGVKRE